LPTPSRTSLEEIVNAGRAILDTDGLDALTMQRVAAAVGVRAPSLYKRVRGRDALVRLIAQDVVVDLGARLSAAAASGDPRADLRAIAVSFRAWAHHHPGGFALLFARLPDAWRLEPSAGRGALDAMFRTVAALAGPDHVLEAARTVVAWASGFVSMELAGAFQLGGDVEAAFAFGVDRLAAAIAAQPMPAGRDSRLD
jgi:AcrR family transcriptional regulator